MWLLLIYFPTVTFAIQVDTSNECAELARLNITTAQSFGNVTPKMVCAKTFAI